LYLRAFAAAVLRQTKKEAITVGLSGFNSCLARKFPILGLNNACSLTNGLSCELICGKDFIKNIFLFVFS